MLFSLIDHILILIYYATIRTSYVLEHEILIYTPLKQFSGV